MSRIGFILCPPSTSRLLKPRGSVVSCGGGREEQGLEPVHVFRRRREEAGAEGQVGSLCCEPVGVSVNTVEKQAEYATMEGADGSSSTVSKESDKIQEIETSEAGETETIIESENREISDEEKEPAGPGSLVTTSARRGGISSEQIKEEEFQCNPPQKVHFR